MTNDVKKLWSVDELENMFKKFTIHQNEIAMESERRYSEIVEKNIELERKNSEINKELEMKNEKIKEYSFRLNENEMLLNEWLSINKTNKTLSYKEIVETNDFTVILNDEDDSQDSGSDFWDHKTFCAIYIKYGNCRKSKCPHSHKSRQWIDKNQPKCIYNNCPYGNVCRFSHN